MKLMSQSVSKKKKEGSAARKSVHISGLLLQVIGILLLVSMTAATATLIDTDAVGNDVLNYDFSAAGESHTFSVSIPADSYIEDASFEIYPKSATEEGELLDSSQADFLLGEMTDLVFDNGEMRLDSYSQDTGLSKGFAGAVLDNTRIYKDKIVLTPGLTGRTVNDDDINIDPYQWVLDNVHIVKGTNGIVHIAYQNKTGYLYYTNSSNDGKNWSTPYLMSKSSLICGFELFITEDDVLYYQASQSTFGGYMAMLYKSVDNGTTWSTLSSNGGLSKVYNPKLAFGSDGTIHAVGKFNTPWWPPSYYVRYFNSTDGGKTWTDSTEVRDITTDFGESYGIAVDDKDVVHIVWDDGRYEAYGDMAIMYANSTDRFTNNKIYFNKDVGTKLPSIAVNGTTVHIAWIDNSTHETNHIKYVYSTDSGKTFSKPGRINSDAGAQNDYCMVAEPKGKMHWVWSELRPKSKDTQDIYYLSGTSGNGVLLDRQYFPKQYFPDLFVDGSGNRLVAYLDNRSVEDDSCLYMNLTWKPRSWGTAGGVLDLTKTPSALKEFRADDAVGKSSQVVYRIRTSDDRVAWSAWESVDKTDASITSSPARYVEWEANLSTTDPSDVPEFTSLLVKAQYYITSGDFVSRTKSIDYVATEVRLNATGNFDGCLFNVSAAENTWMKVMPGVWTPLEFTGSDIRYWVQMCGSSGHTPTIQSVKVEYRADILPKDLQVDLGNDGTVDETYPGFLTGKAVIPLKDELRAAQTEGEDTLFPIKISASYGSIEVKGIGITIDQMPVIDSYAPETVDLKEGESQEFTVSATEPDGDELVYTWYVDGTVVGSTGTYTYEPGYDDAGSHIVRCEVSDGRFTVEKAWSFDVENVNRAPTVLAEEDSITLEWDGMKMLSVTANDPDGDALSYTWTVDGAEAGDDKPTYNLKAVDLGAPGEYVLKCSVSDSDLAAEHEWAVTVKAPVLTMALNTTSVKVAPGNSTSVKLSFTGEHLGTDEVSVAVSPDIFTTGGVYSVSTGGVLKLYVPAETGADNFTLELTATSGIATAVKTLDVQVYVIPDPVDDDDDDDDNVTDDDDDDDNSTVDDDDDDDPDDDITGDDDIVDDDDNDGDGNADDKRSALTGLGILLIVLAVAAIIVAAAVVLIIVKIKNRPQYNEDENDIQDPEPSSEEEEQENHEEETEPSE